MDLQNLTLQTLPQVLPAAEAVFASCIEDATRDCEQRPHDEDARKVVLTFEVIPIVDGET